jgi:hypothetical protein
VLRVLEEHGGPEGLDLSGRDLSDIDLSKKVIMDEVRQKGYSDRVHPVWQSESTGGINLRGANLRGTNLSGAKLGFACLRQTNLQEADLRETVLRYADLEDAVLWDARLEDADLERANLRGANLFGARFLDTYLTRTEVGDVCQEQNSYVLPRGIDLPPQFGRYYQAIAIYRALKQNFDSEGLYSDASWAYVKERQMERKTKAPWRARQYHGHGHPLGIQRIPCYDQLPRWHPLVWWFWLKYFVKWLLDWTTELSCGYGQRPLRTLGVAALVLIVFPFVYRTTAGVGWHDPVLDQDIASTNFLDYVIYSAGAFATIGYEGLKAINTAARVWTAIEALLGIAVVALLMFALGNRMSRS